MTSDPWGGGVDSLHKDLLPVVLRAWFVRH